MNILYKLLFLKYQKTPYFRPRVNRTIFFKFPIYPGYLILRVFFWIFWPLNKSHRNRFFVTVPDRFMTASLPFHERFDRFMTFFWVNGHFLSFVFFINRRKCNTDFLNFSHKRLELHKKVTNDLKRSPPPPLFFPHPNMIIYTPIESPSRI